MQGATHLFIGPMFAGKTRVLMEEAKKAVLALQDVAFLKFEGDTRYAIPGRSDLAHSHDGTCMRAIAVSTLAEDPAELKNAHYDVVCVDEGQFLPGLADFCMRQNVKGRTVYVSALNSKGDAERSGWPEVLKLIPWCNTVNSLQSTCTICRAPAQCSRPIAINDSGGIGGAERYISTCAGCYTAPLSPTILEKRQKAIQRANWLMNQE